MALLFFVLCSWNDVVKVIENFNDLRVLLITMPRGIKSEQPMDCSLIMFERLSLYFVNFNYLTRTLEALLP